MTILPASADLAWWCTAWLRGAAGSDDLLDRFRVGSDVLLRLRAPGVDCAGVALPAPGDPVGLAGPPSLNAAALEHGGAVLVGPLALVDTDQGWQVYDAVPRPAPDLGEADRGLRSAVLRSLEAFADRETLRHAPEVADALTDLASSVDLDPPPGTPAQAVDLATRGARLLQVCALARGRSGPWTPGLGGARDLTALDAAARRAVVGACSGDAWPPVASDPP